MFTLPPASTVKDPVLFKMPRPEMRPLSIREPLFAMAPKLSSWPLFVSDPTMLNVTDGSLTRMPFGVPMVSARSIEQDVEFFVREEIVVPSNVHVAAWPGSTPTARRSGTLSATMV